MVVEEKGRQKMSAMTLTIAKETAYGLTQAANGLGVSVEELAERAIRRYLRETAERKIDVEEAHYKAQHKKLLKSYVGQFIAMHDGKLVDSDTDEIALYLRIRQQYPMVGVLLKRVTSEVEEVWRMRSPRLEYD
jgi:hypothetical protein